MSNEVIKLISISNSIDDYGNVVKTETETEVFAEVKSVMRNEFYSAMAKGLKPEILFVIEDYEDYNDQVEVEYNSVRYKVLKTYKANGHRLELTCYKGVFVNGNA